MKIKLQRLETEVQYLEGFLNVVLAGRATPAQEKALAKDVQKVLLDIRVGKENVRTPRRVESRTYLMRKHG